MKSIFVPTFPTVEAAGRYAEFHKPLKTALEDFANRDAYSQYGEASKKEAMLCWEAASRGDELTMLRHQKALSRVLPSNLFDYVRRS